MGLEFLLGGARSGKSALAVRRASEWGGPVVFIVTGEARDEEMAERIARHQAARPPEWTTVEEPLDLGGALARAPEEAFVVLDCLTLWAANALEAGWSEARVVQVAAEIAAATAARSVPAVVVSNEVGLGLVPDTSLGRSFRDVLGRVNAVFAESAERACLVVAGRTLELG